MRFARKWLNIFLLILFSNSFLYAQNDRALWSLASRLAADIPFMPESFHQCWKTTAGIDLELTWFGKRKTGIALGLHYYPFAIDQKKWIEQLEPNLEGMARLEFKKGDCQAYVASAGLKRIFPFEDRPFLMFFRVAGEYAYLYQKFLQAKTIFPSKTYSQDLKLGQSQYTYGGCAGLGAEVKLSKQWGLVVDAAFHYWMTLKDKNPSPDLNIRSQIPPDQTGKGFCTISMGLTYYLGYPGSAQ